MLAGTCLEFSLWRWLMASLVCCLHSIRMFLLNHDCYFTMPCGKSRAGWRKFQMPSSPISVSSARLLQVCAAHRDAGNHEVPLQKMARHPRKLYSQGHTQGTLMPSENSNTGETPTFPSSLTVRKVAVSDGLKGKHEVCALFRFSRRDRNALKWRHFIGSS